MTDHRIEYAELQDQTLADAGLPADAALMWLGVAEFTHGWVRRAEAVAGYATRCHDIGIEPDEAIRWHDLGASSRSLAAYVERGRSPSDYYAIRRALLEGDFRRSRHRVVLDEWMTSPLSVDEVLLCIRAGLTPTQSVAIFTSNKDPIPALKTLVAMQT